MYINRMVLLLLAVVIIFYPSIEDWVLSGGAAWYRPYQFWLLIIVAAYWNLQTRNSDEL